MKKYNITLSKTFLKAHPKEGQPTGFKESYLAGNKIHTIRTNYDYWEKVIKEVKEGRAVLEIKEWTAKPYNSKQELIDVLDASSGIGLQKVMLDKYNICIEESYNCFNCFQDRVLISRNDGLILKDFINWFFYKKKKGYNIKGIIIHFTKFRY